MAQFAEWSRVFMFLPILTVIAAALTQTGGTAAGAAIANDEQDRLIACIDQLAEDPTVAYEDGLAWLGNGSRPAARHCVALSLIALGEPAEGAHQLEALANAPDGGSIETRSIYLAQAGNAWLVAGYPDAAVTALSNAVKLNRFDASLFKDRAAAHLARRAWQDAANDLDEALSIAPGDAEAHTLRARARLGLEAYDLALEDIDAARALEPENIAILVLRGDIREARRLSQE